MDALVRRVPKTAADKGLKFSNGPPALKIASMSVVSQVSGFVAPQISIKASRFAHFQEPLEGQFNLRISPQIERNRWQSGLIHHKGIDVVVIVVVVGAAVPAGLVS